MPEQGGDDGSRTYAHPLFRASKEFDGPILAPGFAALLRRHPDGVRRGAAGSIVAGVVLFVAASLMTTAGADPVHPAAASAAPPAPAIETYTGLPATPAAPATSASRPRPRPAAQAPTDPSAISGLAANGIPSVALNAYRVAAARLDNADPACGIDWALLAGIGREESDHGRFGGAVLHSDGVSTPRIIGIALNGHGTALVRDTDHGVLDGDRVYDHAVGPMQFIPSTWAEYGTDADGDGHADVFDINDAALTAARYLCIAGGNLRTHAGQVAAVYAYNHSDVYVAQVLALADAYRRGIPISGIPIGDISGALPPVDQGAVPPANPGPPTANPQGTKSGSGTATRTTTPTSTPTPAPRTSASTGGGGAGTGTGTASAGPSSTSPSTGPTPTPTPSGTRSCAVPDPFNPGHCIIWATP